MAFGPIYCETGHPFLFIQEPVNTASNLVIIAFGVRALQMVGRGGWSPGPLVLAVLLLTTGIGSLLWHGLRTPLMLAFDALPGLFYFLVFVFLWMRALYGGAAGAAGLLGVAAAAVGAMLLVRIPLPSARFAPAFAAIAVVGCFYIYLTNRRFGRSAAFQTGTTLLLAALAATFRSIDLYTCSVVPFGTHFLWHIFLSAAAFSGIRFLLGYGGREKAALTA